MPQLSKSPRTYEPGASYLAHVCTVTVQCPGYPLPHQISVWIDVRSGSALCNWIWSEYSGDMFTATLSRIMRDRLGFKQFEVRYDSDSQPAE